MTNSRQSINEFIMIAAIALFSFVLANGLPSYVANTVTNNGTYAMVIPSPGPHYKSLQLQTLAFNTVIPTVPSIAADCGSGITSLLDSKGVKREPENVYATIPASGQSVKTGGKIAVWYHDEHAMTLGAGNIPTMKTSPVDSVFPTQNSLGVGDRTMKDPAGFLVFPALYLLDLTNNPTGQPTDAVNAGNPFIPDAVYGTWKQYNNGGDPTPNYSQLPSGADPFPATGTIQCPSNDSACDFGSEVEWNINSLGLTSGHSYLAVFTIHDGDNTANGSDIGTTCVTIQD